MSENSAVWGKNPHMCCQKCCERESKGETQGFLGKGMVGAVVKNLPASAGDVGSIPGLGRSPGEGNSNPLQYSCLGNPTDSGA